MADLTYAGSSGHSGTDTSRERAEREDADGTTGDLQRLVRGAVSASDTRGVTVAELRDYFSDRHHGSLSSALTNLHRAGRIARLTEVRGRCKVYVLPDCIEGRETEQPSMGRRAAVTAEQRREILQSVVTPKARAHWEEREQDRRAHGDAGCQCALCGVMANIEAN